MDPNDNRKKKEDQAEYFAEPRTEKVKFYLRDSGNLDEEDSTSFGFSVRTEMPRGSPKLFGKSPSQDSDLAEGSGISAKSRRRKFSASIDCSVDLPDGLEQDNDRGSSDDTLTSLDSNSTLERPSSDEIKPTSNVSSSSAGHMTDKQANGPHVVSQKCSGDSESQIHKNNSLENIAEEANDKVTTMLNMSSVEKRIDYRKSSTGSSGYNTGFSSSRSSGQLESTSTTSLPAMENDCFDSEKQFIQRNISTIIEEIDPADVINTMYKERVILSSDIDYIKAISTRRSRAVEFLLLVLTSSKECASSFYSIFMKDYKASFQSITERPVVTNDSNSICSDCLQGVFRLIAEDLQSKENTYNVDSLLVALLEQEVLSPDEVKSVYNQPVEEKIQNVIQKIKSSGVNAINLLRAIQTSALSSSSKGLNNIIDDVKVICCKKCSETLAVVLPDDAQVYNSDQADELDLNIGELELKLLYYDLSTDNEKDRIAVVRIDLEKNAEKVVEVISRKKSELNEAIKEFGKIDQVFIGSVIVVLSFTNKENHTEEYVKTKVTRVLRILLEDEEVRSYIDNQELHVTISFCDGETDCDLISKKLVLTLNKAMLLEELDVIHFKPLFIDRNIMSSEFFHSRFQIERSTRRKRTELFLKYVLSADDRVMDAFLEVITDGSYQIVAEQLKRTQHRIHGNEIFSETRVKCPVDRRKQPTEHNELEHADPHVLTCPEYRNNNNGSLMNIGTVNNNANRSTDGAYTSDNNESLNTNPENTLESNDVSCPQTITVVVNGRGHNVSASEGAQCIHRIINSSACHGTPQRHFDPGITSNQTKNSGTPKENKPNDRTLLNPLAEASCFVSVAQNQLNCAGSCVKKEFFNGNITVTKTSSNPFSEQTQEAGSTDIVYEISSSNNNYSGETENTEVKSVQGHNGLTFPANYVHPEFTPSYTEEQLNHSLGIGCNGTRVLPVDDRNYVHPDFTSSMPKEQPNPPPSNNARHHVENIAFEGKNVIICVNSTPTIVNVNNNENEVENNV